MCLDVSVRHAHAVLRRPEEGVSPPGAGVADSCVLSYGLWGLNSGSLEEQEELLTPEHLFSSQRTFPNVYGGGGVPGTAGLPSEHPYSPALSLAFPFLVFPFPVRILFWFFMTLTQKGTGPSVRFRAILGYTEGSQPAWATEELYVLTSYIFIHELPFIH